MLTKWNLNKNLKEKNKVECYIYHMLSSEVFFELFLSFVPWVYLFHISLIKVTFEGDLIFEEAKPSSLCTFTEFLCNYHRVILLMNFIIFKILFIYLTDRDHK